MKKLLSLFFATALISSSSLVATSTIKTNQVVNKINENTDSWMPTQLSPMQKLINLFNNGVSAGGLDSRNTYNDTLKILKGDSLIYGSNFSITLSTGQNKNKLLKIGDNIIYVDITNTKTNKITKNVKTLLSNVYDYHTIDFFNAENLLESGIDGSKYSVNTTYGSLAALLQNQLVNNFNDKNLKLSLTNQSQSKNYLTSGTNQISFTLKSNTLSETINTKITNVPKSSAWKEYLLWAALAAAVVAGVAIVIYEAVKALQDYLYPDKNILDLAANLLENGVDGSTYSTYNTDSDTLNYLSSFLNQTASGISVTLDQDDQNLVTGTNNIKVNLKYKKASLSDVNVKLNSVFTASINAIFDVLHKATAVFTAPQNSQLQIVTCENIINLYIKNKHSFYFEISLIGDAYSYNQDTIQNYKSHTNTISFTMMTGALPSVFILTL